MSDKEINKTEEKVATAPKKTTKAAATKKVVSKTETKNTGSDGFAIIETGGKQYRVSAGTILEFEKLEGESDKNVTFDKVLLVSNGTDLKIGQPYVEGASVKGTILEQKRDKKIIVFKFKKKTGYKKTQGHRQSLTVVKIDAI